jgi:HAD superfamily hydrolase (TIGR01509 family)
MNDVLQSKSAWIFDLDGTLTNPVHDFAFMRSELGMPADADILKTLSAITGDEKIRLTLKLDTLEAFYAKKAAAAVGARALIKALAEKGCSLGIFTRNTKDMALLSLEAIGVAEFFNDKAIIGRDEAPHKPDPQGIFYLLDQWQVQVSDSVMVGDFKFDLEAGKAAGSTTVHIHSNEQRWPELTDYRFSSLSKLQDALS